MKTKIIYISGSEIFDMCDIRAAFDQVRNTLGLGTDTVLFGVPVDKADALSDNVNITPSVSVMQPDASPNIPEITNEISEPVIVDEVSVTPVVEQVAEIPDEITEPAKEVVQPKKTRGRPKSVKRVEPTPVNETENTEKVVSILSVLTAKQDTDDVSDVADDTADIMPTAAEIISEPIDEATPEIDTVIDDEPIDITDTVEEIPVIDDANDIIDQDASQSVSIDDMITDEAPTVPQEKTLEQLLESMAPLREDLEHEQHIDITDSDDAPISDDTTDAIDMSTDDDATLEQLATEFAENQDKITTAPKTENHGKIGKLKNILPFKKARRDDAGLMGDLFGWAGIAANDEDFAIPGFFTNAASKK